MFDIISITNRHLCHDKFDDRIKKCADSDVGALILREKDLSEEEYLRMAEKVLKICEKSGKKCILHSFYNVAIQLGAKYIHIPLSVLSETDENIRNKFDCIGTSVHSISQLREAESYGVSYVIAGHIFNTDCKKDLEPRGLDFLNNICNNSSVPVYAIGGIDENNIELIRKSGASGAAVMSSIMTCDNPSEYVKELMWR